MPPGRREGRNHDDALHHLVVQAVHSANHRPVIKGTQARHACEVAGEAGGLFNAVQGGHGAEKRAVEVTTQLSWSAGSQGPAAVLTRYQAPRWRRAPGSL